MKSTKPRFFSNKNVKEVGREYAVEVGPHQDIIVLPSTLGDELPGTKCEHGNYIPASSTFRDHAEFCSLCRPYLIEQIKS